MKKEFTLILSIIIVQIGHTQFSDVSASAGLQPMEGSEAIAVGDFNNDGYDDFYVSSIESKNQLYKNMGDGTFVEMSESLGMALEENTVTQAAVWGDINNDGWLDLYVANKAVPDQLFLNKGNENFEEISFEAGIYQQGHPKSVNMADVNNDGWLDIYISNFASENVLYLNNQNNTFTNYTFAAGALDSGKAMGSIFFDYDKDGDVDLYLVHDDYEPNFLYQNDGQGNFTEVGAVAGANTQSFGMGVDIGDINNDGWMDIYIANFGKNILLLNNADGTFSDISETSNTDESGMGWGTNFFDYDKDGLMDIYVVNSPFPNQPVFPNVLYRNLGNLTFEKVESDSPISNEMLSFGSACLDYDLDGNMDVLVANRGQNESTQLLQNSEHPNTWLGLKLIGTTSNQNAIGTKVQITDEFGSIHYREMVAGQSWSSQSSSLLHFGLGEATVINELKVLWTSGLEETLTIDELNQYYTITEGGEVKEGVVNEVSTSVSNILKQNAFHFDVFPNPNDGNFLIELNLEKAQPVLVEVYDIIGQMLYSRKIEHSFIGKNEIPIQLKNVHSKRVILLKIISDNSVSSKRVFLERF